MNQTPNNFSLPEQKTTFSPPQQRVLVTGGTGFLGGYIIKNLIEKGIAVCAIRRSRKKPFFISTQIMDRVDWIEGDVLDVVSLSEAMQGVNAVIHSAAIVSFAKKDRKEMYHVNVEGSANVVNAAIDKGVQRLIHISSVAALGRTNKSEIVSEKRKWIEHKNNTYYAITKHKAELEVWRGFAEGLEGMIVNPSTILGFGDWHQSSCAIFRNAYNQFSWYTKGMNGFVGVEDAAEAIVQLLSSSVNNQRLILNAENLPFRQLFNFIADGFGKRKPFREATPFLGELAWRIEGLKSFLTNKKPLLTRETARIAQSLTQFDNKALLEILPGFSYTSIETIIKNSCKKYIAALESGQLTL